MMKHKPLVAALTLALASSAALAETAQKPQNIYSFDAVVVTASRSEQRLGDVDGSMTVLSDEQLQQNMTNSVDDIFQFTPGVVVSGAGVRGDSPINIRGITGNRVLTQVDGVRQPKTLNFGFLTSSRHFIDPYTIKQVEVIPGPASSLYGSDALGGVVSYNTKNPDDIFTDDGNGIGSSLSGRYNSANEGFSQSASVAARQGNIESMLILSHRDAQETKNKGEVGGTGPSREKADPKDIKDLNVLGKVNMDLGKSGQLNFTAERTHTDEDTQALSGSLEDTVYHDEKQRSRFSASYELASSTPLFDQFKAGVDWQKAQTDQLATYVSRGAPASYDSDYNERLLGLHIDLNKTLRHGNTEHALSYGVNYDDTHFEQLRNSSRSGVARGMPRSESQAAAVYVQDQITLGNSAWRITPGVRYDHYRVDPQPDAEYLANNPNDPDPASSTEGQASFKLGATYDVNDYHSLFGQFAQGFKAPDMDQLYENFARPGAYTGLANPDLKPETVDSFELGYRFEGEFANLEVAAFHNRYDDFIERINLGVEENYPFGVFQNQNLTGVTIEGVEVKGSVDITPQLQVRGALAYADGRSKKDGVEQPLDSVSPLHGTMAVGYSAPSQQWGTELSLNAAAGKKRADVNAEDVFLAPGYAVANLSAYRQLGKNVRLDAGVYNLADKQYWEWESVRHLSAEQRSRSEPGRHYRVGLQWDF